MKVYQIIDQISEDSSMTEAGHEEFWNSCDRQDRNALAGRVQNGNCSVSEAVALINEEALQSRDAIAEELREAAAMVA